jgi:hypothetical protein
MTGTKDGDIASAQRLIERDSVAVQSTLRQKALDLETYHEPLLALARPILVEVVELYAAAFQAGGANREDSALLAVAMALHDTDLYRNFHARVEARNAGLSRDLLAQRDRGVVIHSLPTEGSKS